MIFSKTKSVLFLSLLLVTQSFSRAILELEETTPSIEEELKVSTEQPIHVESAIEEHKATEQPIHVEPAIVEEHKESSQQAHVEPVVEEHKAVEQPIHAEPVIEEHKPIIENPTHVESVVEEHKESSQQAHVEPVAEEHKDTHVEATIEEQKAVEQPIHVEPIVEEHKESVQPSHLEAAIEEHKTAEQPIHVEPEVQQQKIESATNEEAHHVIAEPPLIASHSETETEPKHTEEHPKVEVEQLPVVTEEHSLHEIAQSQVVHQELPAATEEHSGVETPQHHEPSIIEEHQSVVAEPSHTQDEPSQHHVPIEEHTSHVVETHVSVVHHEPVSFEHPHVEAVQAAPNVEVAETAIHPETHGSIESSIGHIEFVESLASPEETNKEAKPASEPCSASNSDLVELFKIKFFVKKNIISSLIAH